MNRISSMILAAAFTLPSSIFAQTPATPTTSDPAAATPPQKVLHGNLCRTGVSGCDRLLVIRSEDTRYSLTIWRADFDLTGVVSAKVVDKDGAEVDKLPVAIADNATRNLSLSVLVPADASEGTYYLQPHGLDDSEVSFTVKSATTIAAEERERKLNGAIANAAAAAAKATDLQKKLDAAKTAQTTLENKMKELEKLVAAAATKSDLEIVAKATKETADKLPQIQTDIAAAASKAKDAATSVLSLDTRVTDLGTAQTKLAGLIERLGRTEKVEKRAFHKERRFETNSEVAKEAANFMREHPLPPTAVATNQK